nr:immunoglobulin heavy chain junction region [Mus musculus]
CAIYGNSFDYW